MEARLFSKRNMLRKPTHSPCSCSEGFGGASPSSRYGDSGRSLRPETLGDAFPSLDSPAAGFSSDMSGPSAICSGRTGLLLLLLPLPPPLLLLL